MPEASFILLEEGSTSHKSRGVNFKACRVIGVPEDKDGGQYEGILEGGESSLLGVFPFPGSLLLGQVMKWASNFGEVLTVVEIRKT